MLVWVGLFRIRDMEEKPDLDLFLETFPICTGSGMHL